LDAPLVFIEQLGGGAAGAKSGWLEPHLPHIGSPTSCWISATGPAASELPCCLSGFVYCKTLSFVLQGGGGSGGGGGKGGYRDVGKIYGEFFPYFDYFAFLLARTFCDILFTSPPTNLCLYLALFGF